MHAGDGGQLDAVKRHHLGVGTDGAHNVEGLHPAEPVGLGCAGGGADAGVEAIDVDPDIARYCVDLAAATRADAAVADTRSSITNKSFCMRFFLLNLVTWTDIRVLLASDK